MRKTTLVKQAETPTFREMRSRAMLAIEDSQLVTIIGQAGSGKSNFGQYLVEQFGEQAILATVDVDIIKDMSFAFRLICRAMHIDEYRIGRLSGYRLHDAVKEFLSDQYYVLPRARPFLIIDEAQRIQPHVLRAIIDLNDAESGPRAGLILLANDQFLSGKVDREFALEQISSRTEPNELRVTTTWEDYRQVAIANEVQGKPAYDFLKFRFDKGRQRIGSAARPQLRDLTSLLTKARMMMAEGPITIDILENAASQMGNHAAYRMAAV